MRSGKLGLNVINDLNIASDPYTTRELQPAPAGSQPTGAGDINERPYN
jgi:hypothetical protein